MLLLSWACTMILNGLAAVIGGVRVAPVDASRISNTNFVAVPETIDRLGVMDGATDVSVGSARIFPVPGIPAEANTLLKPALIARPRWSPQ